MRYLFSDVIKLNTVEEYVFQYESLVARNTERGILPG